MNITNLDNQSNQSKWITSNAKNEKNNNFKKNKLVFIVPHTHWDREWYLPFQFFRHDLVKMMDLLLELMKKHEFYFTLDGQVIVLEDYLEIRPEKQDELFDLIRNERIVVGPWYVLMDEWLVGEESLIRNLELARKIAKRMNIPLMNVGYLPDQFGHSRVIPQLLSNVAGINKVVLWRGVGPDVNEVPFFWKSHPKSKTTILGIYLPFGYGNAAHLDGNTKDLTRQIRSLVDDLEPWSPVPVYLLHNGTDHQFPNENIAKNIPSVKIEGMEIKLAVLTKFIEALEKHLKENKVHLIEHVGEFREPFRAPLLQDTYSSRMWIKQWNQKVEDLLVHFVEPIHSLVALNFNEEYPSRFLEVAWKWLLKNHPHDSICGCSIDQTHDEMKSRFSWAESIGKKLLEEAFKTIKSKVSESKEKYLLIYNPSNASDVPILFETTVPARLDVKGLLIDGQFYPVHTRYTKEEPFWEGTFGATKLKAMLKLVPGRKIADLYLNDVFYKKQDTGVCDIVLVADNKPIGEFNINKMKKEFVDFLNTSGCKKFHVIIQKEPQQIITAMVPLKPWSFTLAKIITSEDHAPEKTKPARDEQALKDASQILVGNEKEVSTPFFDVYFNKDGSLKVIDKTNGVVFDQIYFFEDLGDRGDEYTFGRVDPNLAKAKNVSRKVILRTPFMIKIEQRMDLEVFKELHPSREKRQGKTRIPIITTFTFYKDISRVDFHVKMKNTAKDHRLRACFKLPWKTDKSCTSTHFGWIERSTVPRMIDSAAERPSGIQPQKRFIRVDPPRDSPPTSVSIFNVGLPEVEVIDGRIIAITLLRCVEWLSRGDIPERPAHAGPFLPTPGAQELDEEYEFDLAFMLHSRTEPVTSTIDHSEAFSLNARAEYLEGSLPSKTLLVPMIDLRDKNLKISSIRFDDDGNLLVTVYNPSFVAITSSMKIHTNIKKLQHVRLDETIIQDVSLNNKNEIELSFDPLEIKMLKLIPK